MNAKVTTPGDMRNQSNQKEEERRESSQTLKKLLVKQRHQIELALPRHLNADRLLRVALTAISKTPRLADCTQVSVLGSIIQAAQLGLEPDGALGHAYLVPFWNSKKGCYECQMIPGYRGMLDIAGRSGKVITVSARVVYEYDFFDYAYGLDDYLKHKPNDGDRGQETHVYAVAKLTNGGHHFEVMTIGEVKDVRNESSGYQAYKSGKIPSTPWVDHFEDMARKTPVRKLFKWLPVSIEMQKAVGLDDLAETGISQDLDALVIDVEPEPKRITPEVKKTQPQNSEQTKQKEEVKETAKEEPRDQQTDQESDGQEQPTEDGGMTPEDIAAAEELERQEAASYEDEERAAIQEESQGADEPEQIPLDGHDPPQQSTRRRSRLQQRKER